MKKFFCFSSILVISFLASNAYGHFTGKGHVHTLSKTAQVFWNPDCRSTDTCDLKRFTLTTSVYEIWFSDDPHYPTYGNGVIMEYETNSVDTLEKYAIVQFMKGCVFDSSKNGDGKISRNVNYTIPSFGEDIPYCFPEWVIDSQDTDPVYNSDPEYGRFYLLRWNKSGSYDYPNHKYYGAEKPKIPVVYMADYPAGVFVRATAVRNAALEFKTCIYKASDVPTKTRRDDINFAKPLTCFEWQNVYVYDFAKGRFENSWVDVPSLGEPYVPLKEYLLVIFVTLFIAFALVTFSRSGSFLNQKDSY
ncbi:MAG TPA: hypothetical protein VNY32_10335 [Candidatus Acidoferrales bacterium]|nr:hypothetical protein [Candidatus Acidoferrales bacterium]